LLGVAVGDLLAVVGSLVTGALLGLSVGKLPGLEVAETFGLAVGKEVGFDDEGFNDVGITLGLPVVGDEGEASTE
jgi:hypothetical protein